MYFNLRKSSETFSYRLLGAVFYTDVLSCYSDRILRSSICNVNFFDSEFSAYLPYKFIVLQASFCYFDEVKKDLRLWCYKHFKNALFFAIFRFAKFSEFLLYQRMKFCPVMFLSKVRVRNRNTFFVDDTQSINLAAIFEARKFLELSKND